MKVFISHYGKCAMYTKEGVHIGSISHFILCALHTYMSVRLETLFAHHYWCAIHTLFFTVWGGASNPICPSSFETLRLLLCSSVPVDVLLPG